MASLELEMIDKELQEKNAAGAAAAPDTGVKPRPRKNSTSDRLIDEIRVYRQENTDFQDTIKRDLQKQRDRMDFESNEIKTTISDSMRQVLGELTSVGSQQEPEPRSHDPEPPAQHPTEPTKAAEATIAEKSKKPP